MKPYSNDLRQRVVYAYENKQGSYRVLAERFMVSLKFVYDMIKLYRQTGSVSPKPHAGGCAPKISGNGLKTLGELHKETSDATLQELCHEFYGQTGIEVSQSAMHNTLIRLGLSRKKKLSGRLSRKGRM